MNETDIDMVRILGIPVRVSSAVPPGCVYVTSLSPGQQTAILGTEAMQRLKEAARSEVQSAARHVLTSIPTGSPTVTRRRIYRSSYPGGELHLISEEPVSDPPPAHPNCRSEFLVSAQQWNQSREPLVPVEQKPQVPTPAEPAGHRGISLKGPLGGE